MTLRELFVRFQGYLLTQWDHTADLKWTIAHAFGGKSKLEINDFHHFRESKQRSVRIHRGNMEVAAMAFCL